MVYQFWNVSILYCLSFAILSYMFALQIANLLCALSILLALRPYSIRN